MKTMEKPENEHKGSDGSPLTATPCSRADTKRLEFLLQFFGIEDVGDEDFCPGLALDYDALMEKVGYGPPDEKERRWSNVLSRDDDLRDVIDRALQSHSENVRDQRQLPQ